MAVMITRDDFLKMVKGQDLEVHTSLEPISKSIRGTLEKSLTEELTLYEIVNTNHSLQTLQGFTKWEVLKDDFTKSILYTRPSQVDWLDADKGEFGEIIKARSGIYKNTAENRVLNRVGQKYGQTTPKAEPSPTPKTSISVGDKYHSPAPEGGESIDFTITSIKDGKYSIETRYEDGEKGTHTFDEKAMKELIAESKKIGSNKSGEKSEGASIFKQDHPTKTKGDSKLNYVTAISNIMDWKKHKPVTVSGGYRVELGLPHIWTGEEQKKLIDFIKKEEPSIPADKIKFRERGPGSRFNSVDMIVPRDEVSSIILDFKKKDAF